MPGCGMSDCAKKKPRVSARRLICEFVSLGQRERWHVVRLRNRDHFNHLKLGIHHLLRTGSQLGFRFAFSHALFNPLLTIEDPHRASFPTASPASPERQSIVQAPCQVARRPSGSALTTYTAGFGGRSAGLSSEGLSAVRRNGQLPGVDDQPASDRRRRDATCGLFLPPSSPQTFSRIRAAETMRPSQNGAPRGAARESLPCTRREKPFPLPRSSRRRNTAPLPSDCSGHRRWPPALCRPPLPAATVRRVPESCPARRSRGRRPRR